jgi:hypothetical protein
MTAADGCQACHAQINPVGFPFEHFDGIGRYRDTENGYPIDASGAITAGDASGSVSGAVELVQRLAGSADVARCLATQWFRFRFGRLGGASDTALVAKLGDDLRAQGGKLRSLPLAIASSPVLGYRHLELPSPGGASP